MVIDGACSHCGSKVGEREYHDDRVCIEGLRDHKRIVMQLYGELADGIAMITGYDGPKDAEHLGAHLASIMGDLMRQREAIRKAPHAYLCASGRVSDKGLTSEQYRARYAAACDCWKRDALGEEDAQ